MEDNELIENNEELDEDELDEISNEIDRISASMNENRDIEIETLNNTIDKMQTMITNLKLDYNDKILSGGISNSIKKEKLSDKEIDNLVYN